MKRNRNKNYAMMKQLFAKMWQWLMALPQDKLWHVIAGLVIGALFAIVLPMEAPIVPVVFAGAIKEFVDQWRTGAGDWRDFVATLAGGAVIQVMVWIG